MVGLFKVKYDPNIGAAHLEQDGTAVLFKGSDGKYYPDQARHGNVSDLSDNALLVQVKDITLLEAVNSFIENRKPRWIPE